MEPEREERDRWSEARDDDEGALGIPAFVKDPIGVLRRRWLWMALVGAIGLVVTAILVVAWVPVYKAKATVLITSQQIPEDFVRSTVQEDTISNIAAMLGKVLSQENLLAMVDEHDLYPGAGGVAPRLDLVARMRSDIEIGPEPSPSRGYSASQIWYMTYQSRDRVKAAIVANALAELFVQNSTERRNAQARKTTEFLRGALERDEEELREQSRAVSELRREHRGELPSELDTHLRKLDLASQRRQSLTDQIAAKRNQISSLRSVPGNRAASENADLLDELRRQFARERAVHTDEHPNVIALRLRMARLEEIVREESAGGAAVSPDVARMMATERFELAQMESQLRQTENVIADLSGKIDRTPLVAEQLEALEQKESVLRDNYLRSLAKVEEAELAESLESDQQGARVSTLDVASPPASPTRPRSLVAAVALSATIVSMLSLAVLLELVDPVVVSLDQLESITERPGLGALPRIG